jgi:hypothetical protein
LLTKSNIHIRAALAHWQAQACGKSVFFCYGPDKHALAAQRQRIHVQRGLRVRKKPDAARHDIDNPHSKLGGRPAHHAQIIIAAVRDKLAVLLNCRPRTDLTGVFLPTAPHNILSRRWNR